MREASCCARHGAARIGVGLATIAMLVALLALAVSAPSSSGAPAKPKVAAKATWKVASSSTKRVRITGRVAGTVRRPAPVQARWRAQLQLRRAATKTVRGKKRSVVSWRTVASSKVKGRKHTFNLSWKPGKQRRPMVRVRVVAGARVIAAPKPLRRTIKLKAPVPVDPDRPAMPIPLRPSNPVPTPPAPPSPHTTAPPAPPAPPSPPEPKAPLVIDADPVGVMVGSATLLALGDQITRIDSATLVEPTGGSVSVEAANGSVWVHAPMGAHTGRTQLTIEASGCLEDGECEREIRIKVAVDVVPLAAAEETGGNFTSASSDRVAAADPMPEPLAGRVLVDELIIILGADDEPGTRDQADAAAAAVDGVITGGIEHLGIFQVRWPTPQDIDARTSQLLAQPNVTGVDISGVQTVADSSLPSEWTQMGFNNRWHHELIRSDAAWALFPDSAPGANVRVGVLDGSAVDRHPELWVPTSTQAHP